jgi:hypothetical protein
MDAGLERIRQLSRQARENGSHAAELEKQACEMNRTHLTQLEAAIPARLGALAAASDGDLTYEASAFRSQASTAMRINWRNGQSDGHAVELWLQRDNGSVEWRWEMGYREPAIIHRVPATRFDLNRLDDLVAALADPTRWLGGHPPEV